MCLSDESNSYIINSALKTKLDLYPSYSIIKQILLIENLQTRISSIHFKNQ